MPSDFCVLVCHKGFKRPLLILGSPEGFNFSKRCPETRAKLNPRDPKINWEFVALKVRPRTGGGEGEAPPAHTFAGGRPVAYGRERLTGQKQKMYVGGGDSGTFPQQNRGCAGKTLYLYLTWLGKGPMFST